MKRITLLTATAALAIAATGVIATAQNTMPERPDGRPDRAAMMFERFDTNGDGTITRAEVDAAHADRFASADTDGDGLLSVEELAAALETRRVERQQVGMARMIERLDANGDGLLSVEEAAATGPRGDMFARLDADENGEITMAELEQARDGHRGGMDRMRGHGQGKGQGAEHGNGHGKRTWWGRGNN